MWIKLISPRVTMRPMDSAFKRQMAPPLSLLVLGALTPKEHRVTIADENIERITTDDTPDLVALTVKADTARRSQELSQIYRARGIPVIFGGIYPTTNPDDNLAYADACVIGEAEELWGQILSDLTRGELKKIYRNEAPVDLAKVPIPRWELIAEKNYLYTNTLTIGRGCPWRCDFCYNSSPNLPVGYRMKPLENIFREIRSLKSRHVMFIDDNFIASPNRARELLRRFESLGLTWHTAVSADIGRHEDILDLMAATGCRSLFIGFESLNQKNLARSRKRQNRIEEYNRTIEMIHQRGMMVNASIVFGFDDDGPEVFNRTVDWLIAQKVESMTAHIMTPYPGTRLHAQLVEAKRITDFDLTHYNTSRVVFEPARMTAAELSLGYLRAYARFYSWRSMVKRLPADHRRIVSYLLFNLFYRKFGKLVSAVGMAGLMRFIGKLGARLSYPDLSGKLLDSVRARDRGSSKPTTPDRLVSEGERDCAA